MYEVRSAWFTRPQCLNEKECPKSRQIKSKENPKATPYCETTEDQRTCQYLLGYIYPPDFVVQISDTNSQPPSDICKMCVCTHLHINVYVYIYSCLGKKKNQAKKATRDLGKKLERN